MRLNRIGVKLALTIVALLAVQVAVRSYIEARADEANFREDFLRAGRTHALSVAQGAEYGLLTRDRKELEQVAAVRWTAGDTDLVCVAFYDAAGALVAQKHWRPGAAALVPARAEPVDEMCVEPCARPGPGAEDCFLFKVPVRVSREVIRPDLDALAPAGPEADAGEHAMVLCARSYEGVKRRIADAQKRMILVSAAVLGAAIVAVTLYSRKLVRPIEGLVRGTERVASGDLEAHVDVGRRRDELTRLADSFNRMTGQLRDQRAEILAYSQELEGKVADRTAALAEANTRLQAANRQLEELATTDDLTGLWNRRRFHEMLDREIRRAARTGSALALAMLDIDRFKAINDTFGHAFGDRVLAAVAGELQGQARSTDIVARYGGEEFMVLMPDTSAEEAVGAAERLRKRIAGRPVADGKRAVDVTVSVGISGLGPGGAADAETLVRLADETLYAAKQAGRNCTKTWNELARDGRSEALAQAPEVVELQRRMATLSLQARDAFVQSIQGLIQALEARDPYTRCHSENVTRYATGIAEAMGLDAEEAAVVRRAARVHDIGKIGVPDAVLRKPGPLDADERAAMEQHVLVGVRILEQMRFLEREVPIVRHHHERWDGRGYPDGIAGRAIPVGARILAVADAFDALTSDRPYHDAADAAEALRTLIEESGRQFDADVVDALIRWVRAAGRAGGDPAGVTVEHVLNAPPPRNA